MTNVYLKGMQRLLDYNYLYLVPLLLSAIFSLKSFRLKWPMALQMISIFLLASLFVETFAIAWTWSIHRTRWWNYAENNLWLYNGFVSVRQVFLLFYFYQLLTSGTVKQWIRWTAPVYFAIGIVNYFWWQGPFQVNTYTIILANTTTVVLCLFFFIQVLKDDRVIVLGKSTEFWFGLGTFLYYSGTLPFFISFNYLIQKQPELVLSYLYINDVLNITMYTLYLIAFLCRPHILK